MSAKIGSDKSSRLQVATYLGYKIYLDTKTGYFSAEKVGRDTLSGTDYSYLKQTVRDTNRFHASSKSLKWIPVVKSRFLYGGIEHEDLYFAYDEVAGMAYLCKTANDASQLPVRPTRKDRWMRGWFEWDGKFPYKPSEVAYDFFVDTATSKSQEFQIKIQLVDRVARALERLNNPFFRENFDLAMNGTYHIHAIEKVLSPMFEVLPQSEWVDLVTQISEIILQISKGVALLQEKVCTGGADTHVWGEFIEGRGDGMIIGTHICTGCGKTGVKYEGDEEIYS